MKKIAILSVAVLLFCLIDQANAENPIESEVREPKEPVVGEPSAPAIVAPGIEQKASEPGEKPPSLPELPGVSEIYFAAGTVSADDKYFYVIFDRFLLQYALPALDLKRKLDLNIAIAPVNPSISISKDSKYLYIIHNGILHLVDTTTFKIEKRIKITP